MNTIPRLVQNQAAIDQAAKVGLRSLRTPRPLRSDEWIEQNFYLSPESSYEEGPMKLFAFQVGMAQIMGDDDVEEVWIQKSARVGYTKLLIGVLQYLIEHKRRNAAIWWPRDEDRDYFVKAEVEPAIRDNPAIRRIFPKYGKKSKHNTLALKQFVGASLHLRGGKAARSYRGLTVDVAALDELDGFDRNIEQEGKPFKLAGRRVQGSAFKKLINGSTPKIKGISMIEEGEELCEVRIRWYVPCPKCNHEQILQWGGKDKDYGFKWEGTGREAAKTVRYQCENCHETFTEREYRAQGIERGRWMTLDREMWLDHRTGIWREQAGKPVETPRRVGIHVWSAVNDRVPWSLIVSEWQDAQNDKGELQEFVNLTLGETWEEEGVSSFDFEILHRTRREAYDAEVPDEVTAITFGVDHQDDRFEMQWDGWGPFEERWTLDYQVLNGDLSKPTVWRQLREILKRQFRKADGSIHEPVLGCIDHGGHFSREVVELCRSMPQMFLIPIKGSSQYGKPIINWPKRRNKDGVYLVEVGQDTGKTLMLRRLMIDKPGPGFWHWPRLEVFDEEYFKQLTAEEMRPKWTAGGKKMVWQLKKGRQRNEPWDCSNYSLAAIRIAQQRFGIALDNPDTVPQPRVEEADRDGEMDLEELARELNDG